MGLFSRKPKVITRADLSDEDIAEMRRRADSRSGRPRREPSPGPPAGGRPDEPPAAVPRTPEDERSLARARAKEERRTARAVARADARNRRHVEDRAHHEGRLLHGLLIGADGTLTFRGHVVPVSEARAEVVATGQLRARSGGFVSIHGIGLGTTTAADERELFLVVDHRDGQWVVACDPRRQLLVRQFAARLNSAARRG